MVATEKTGTLAVGSIIAAVLSFILTFAGHPVFGVFSAIISIPLGIIGLMMAASPRVSGGLLSIAAIIMGVIAIGVGVLGGIGKIVF